MLTIERKACLRRSSSTVVNTGFLNQISASRARFPLHIIRKIFNKPFPFIFHNFKFAVAGVCPGPRRRFIQCQFVCRKRKVIFVTVNIYVRLLPTSGYKQ